MRFEMDKIITAANQAPSGENCQPWRFEVRGNELTIFLVPERDQSFYNERQKGSLVAVGAAVENALIAASALGYQPQLVLSPEETNKNLIARISLLEGPSKNDALYNFIPLRISNRKKYYAVSLTTTERNELLRVAQEAGGTLLLLEDEDEKKALARTVSLNERLIFENKNLHHFFFTHLNWTKEEEKKRGTGFFIPSLELEPKKVSAMKLFSRWPILKILNHLGVSGMVAKDNAQTYASSAAFGAILTKGDTPKDFVDAGRILERVWLNATKLGLWMQPTTGVIFLMQKIRSGNTSGFSGREIGLIEKAYQDICSLLRVTSGETIPLLFRTGHADSPTARSGRRPPEVIRH